MAQRLGFIFALASKPEIILMDEPTSALDADVINLFVNKIKEYTKQNNSTILLVTHDILFANEISDYLALLEDKTINQFFTTKEFFEKHSFIKRDL